MAFQHKNIANALGWKHNHQPGMSTRNGVVTEFPGGIPTDAELAQWVSEYEALPPDDPIKDPRADRRKRLQAANTVAELRAVVLELL